MNRHDKIKNNAVRIIMANMTIGYYMDYELVSAKLRRKINLKNWDIEIITGVQSVLPHAQVDVFKDFFRITVRVLPVLSELQRIGKNIASNQHIGINVRVHKYKMTIGITGKSKKLFIRKKQSIKSIYV